jgi:hypothetical protein
MAKEKTYKYILNGVELLTSTDDKIKFNLKRLPAFDKIKVEKVGKPTWEGETDGD